MENFEFGTHQPTELRLWAKDKFIKGARLEHNTGALNVGTGFQKLGDPEQVSTIPAGETIVSIKIRTSAKEIPMRLC